MAAKPKAEAIRYARVGEFTNADVISFEQRKIRGHDAYVAKVQGDQGDQLVRLNRVTSVKGILEKDALIGWAAKMACLHVNAAWDLEAQPYTQEDKDRIIKEARSHWRDFRDEAGGWGTTAHKAIEEWFKSGDWPSEPLPQQVDNALGLFTEFWDNSGYRVMEVEKPLYYMPLAVGGLGDWLGWDEQGRLGILDYKTSSGIWADFHIQVAAYFNMARGMGLPVEWAAILHIGKYDPFPRCQILTEKQLEAGWQMFRHLAHVYPLWKAAKAEQDALNQQWRLYVEGQLKQSEDEKFQEIMEAFTDEDAA